MSYSELKLNKDEIEYKINNFVSYGKFNKKTGIHDNTIYGLKSCNEGHYYPFIDYNLFSKQEEKIPNDLEQFKCNSYCLKDHVGYLLRYDQMAWDKNFHSNLNENEEIYYIHDNGGTPFLVKHNSKTNLIEIFRQPHNLLRPNYGKYVDEVSETYVYNELIFTSDEYEVHIGQDEDCDGNTILLKKGSEYIFIGPSILTFNFEDPFVKYYSHINGSDVSYPIMESEKYVCNINFDEVNYFPKNLINNNYIYKGFFEMRDSKITPTNINFKTMIERDCQ